MKYSTTLDLRVPAERAWKVLSDIRHWPEWTSTVESIDTEPGPVHVGQAVAVKQPGRRVAHYQIDLVETGSRFRWGSNKGGVRQAADHRVTPTGPNSCRVMLTFGMSGPLGVVLGALGASKIRSMVDGEAGALASRLSRDCNATSA